MKPCSSLRQLHVLYLFWLRILAATPRPRGGASRKEGDGGNARRPISRVLCTGLKLANQPAPAMAIHLGRSLPNASRDRPGQRLENCPVQDFPKEIKNLLSLLGLAPGGVCPAMTVAGHAVRSYRTISPLPSPLPDPAVCFCGTVPGVAPAGRYPAPCFRGARTFLPHADRCRSAEGGHLAVWRAQS